MTPVFDSPDERDRVQRVLWLREAGRQLSRLDGPAAAFLASAIGAVLGRGGSLEARLRIAAPRGSHRTPKWIIENCAPHPDDGALGSAQPDPNPDREKPR